ncbi:peptidase M4 family protein [Parashewanella curva]|uniref:Neutral metalloproteinase n=1 Tax=Parashewanella curva TaxID=2338552 RepID=A0A3L8Q0C7_9GAMM|nr:M4 family metallopeptidase [Parashewanella curva]RLV60469.1 peptidase M4 family protein [Parashewanella curva]
MTRTINKTVLSILIGATFCSSAFAADIVDVNQLSISASNNLTQDLQLDSNSQYQVANTASLPNNQKKYRLQQYYNQVPIYGYTIAAAKNSVGSYTDLQGLAVVNINQDQKFTKPSFSSDEALNKAIALNASKSLSQHQITNKEAKLWVYLDAKQQPKLVYITSYFVDSQNPSRPYTIMDAHSGQIIEQWDGLTTAEIATGFGGNEKTGQYQYGQDFPKLDVTQNGDDCTMENANEQTFDYNKWHWWQFHHKPIKFTCPNHDEKEVHGAYGPENDAHYFGGIVFKMYGDWLNTRPIKQTLQLRVHFQHNLDNAMWDGKRMNFGDGSTLFYPLVSLDVTAHEISHGFTQQHSNLAYQGQSGGMNEAFSDMAGEAAKFYAYKKNDFQVGTSIVKNERKLGKALRYMDDPTKDGHSIGSAKDYNPTLNVHFSSGVYNKAFYELATTDGWDTQKAFEAFATANELYWNANSNFKKGACGVVKAAQDLKLPQEDVINAFSQVDINNPCH